MRALLLTFLLLSASASVYNPFSAFSGQRPLTPYIDSSNQPYFPPVWIRCDFPRQWRCYYSILLEPVHCQCVLPSNESGRAKGNTGTGGRVEKENATSLEVMTEIQPGNNETLVSLFEMQCEEKNFVGCVSSGGEGFVCGCHEWGCDSAEEGPEDDYENDAELKIMEHKESELEESRLTKSRDFRFQQFRFPRCNKPGYHVKCCSYNGKSQCFCAGNGVRCPPQ